ncbi:unnamed protein product, partial [Candidula unifasciata]
CLHRHLTAWYDLVLSKRLLMGKIKAMSDWKLMLKVWGAWRLHARRQKLEMETEIHERNVIDTERKRLTAERHYTHAVLKRCFLAWHQFITEMIERKELEKEQERTKSKIMSLLNAVASGRMSNEDHRTEDGQYSQFSSPLTIAHNARSHNNTHKDCCSTVTKRHLKMIETDSNMQQKYTDAEIRKKFGTQPWMNRHFVVNNFENRYTAQQQTLREQQSQIREQRQLIEELQYHQRQQTLRQQLSQISDLHLPAPSAEVEEQSSAITSSHASCAVVRVNNTKYLKVLKNVEDRAAKRAKLKAEREERKRKQEEDKLAQLQKIEEETQKTLEAERKAKIEDYRQRKRLEKQKEEEKRKELAKLEEMNKLADEHYKRSLMKYRGLLPFKKIISLSKKQWVMAIKHRDREVVRQCIQAWRLFADEEINRKQSMADQMSQVLVIKHTFQKWKNYKHHMKFLNQRAARHYDSHLKSQCFSAWVEWKTTEREDTQQKLEAADSHFLKTLTRKTFLSWRDLPEKLRREQEREKRRMELRQKVAELIPDFSPQMPNVVTESGELS